MIKNLHRLPRLLAQVAVVSTLAGVGNAALAAASASVEFTSFSYTTSGGTLVWSAPDAYQDLSAEATEAGGIGGTDSDTHTASNWVAGNVSASTASAAASVTVAGNQTFSAMASADPNFLSPFAFPHSSMAIGSMSGSFNLTAAGTVTFVVAYIVDVSAPGGNDTDYLASALARLTVGNYATGNASTVTLQQQSFDNAAGVSHAKGSFSVTMAVDGVSDVGYYDLMANATAFAPAAVVPEPASLAMWLVGATGVGLWTRRQRRTWA